MKIKNSKAGNIISMPKGYSAFVPNKLPPKLDWNTQIINALSRADFLLGKLAREGSKLPNPHLLLRPFITREAVLSSKIEGTQATIGEVLASNAGVVSKAKDDDLQEVENYIEALEHGIDSLKTLPLSLRLIREMHDKLMQGVRGSYATPGEFRKSQNWIGAVGCTLNTAKFVPPPPDVLMECLGDLEIFLHNRELPPLIHIALCHYQFEAIHPFLDGNGRIGRLLIILLLIERNILPSPILYLSAFFEATRNEYYRQLYNVSSEGSWDEWLVYFLNGISVQSEDALERAEKINQLINDWKTMTVGEGSKILLKIIDHLAVNPYITINKIAEDFEVAYTTAKRGILKLEELKIIQQDNDNKRKKVYCAKGILDALEAPNVT